jgi:2-haloacid dehalogenase
MSRGPTLVRMGERWATFDCYGTLVDWNGGIRSTLASLWPDADADALLQRYHAIEPAIQAREPMTYRRVMAEVLWRLSAAEKLTIPKGRADALAESLPSWRVFPEVPDALRQLHADGWRLAILSNTDADFLDASMAAVGVEPDARVVASEILSYKPNPAHWEEFFARTGAERDGHVHVAASLFHDVAPCARLGLRCVWINREDETSDLPRTGELTDLEGLPDTLRELVAG